MTDVGRGSQVNIRGGKLDTFMAEVRGDMLDTFMAEVDKRFDLVGKVEYSSSESILSPLGWLGRSGEVGKSVRRSGGSRMEARRESLAWEGSGRTGGSLYLYFLQRLIERLKRIRVHEPTVEKVKYFIVFQRTTFSGGIEVRNVDRTGWGVRDPAIRNVAISNTSKGQL